MRASPIHRLLRRRLCLSVAGLAGSGLLLPGPARAEPTIYPSRPIRLLVGDTAGSPADLIARALGPQLQAALGQPVSVENRPGQGGAVAARVVIATPGDGHTLLLASDAALKLARQGAADLDLMPIALVCRLRAGPATAHWLALLGPANMHAGVAMRVHAVVQAALADAGFQGRLAAAGAEPLPALRQALAALLQADVAAGSAPRRLPD